MVISTVNQVVYNGDGVTTAFPFTFRIIEVTDIKLLLIDADGAETDITADYYVNKVNNTVYYPGYAPGAEPPAEDQPPKVQTGQKLVVYRELPITQEKDLGEKWPFYVIELGLDKLTMILQQIFDWWGRTLKISQGGSVDGFDTNIYPEAGKVVAVNEDGDGFESVTAMVEENNAWEGKGLQIHNIAGPSSVTDAVTKDYVDQILNGFVLAGDSRTVPFDTLAQLRVADIEAGQIAFTLGYNDVNDGGAGVYTIRTATPSDVDNGGSIIVLDNGKVAERIKSSTVQFLFPANEMSTVAWDCELIVTDTSVLMIDSGIDDVDIRQYLIDYMLAHGIKKVDYFLLTHYHADHDGNVIPFLNQSTVDFSQTKWFLPYVSLGFDSRKQAILTALQAHGADYEVLTDDTTVQLAPDVNMDIWGASAEFRQFIEDNTPDPTDLNVYSLWALIRHKNVNALYCGDGYYPATKGILEYYDVPKIDLLKIPHHGSQSWQDQGWDYQFYAKTSCDYAVCNYPYDKLVQYVTATNPFGIEKRFSYQFAFACGAEICPTHFGDVEFTSDGDVVPLVSNSKTINSRYNEHPIFVYVDASYTDADADGSEDKPYQDINTAIDSLPDRADATGVTISIEAGTYASLILTTFSGEIRFYTSGTVNIGQIFISNCTDVYMQGTFTAKVFRVNKSNVTGRTITITPDDSYAYQNTNMRVLLPNLIYSADNNLPVCIANSMMFFSNMTIDGANMPNDYDKYLLGGVYRSTISVENLTVKNVTSPTDYVLDMMFGTTAFFDEVTVESTSKEVFRLFRGAYLQLNTVTLADTFTSNLIHYNGGVVENASAPIRGTTADRPDNAILPYSFLYMDTTVGCLCVKVANYWYKATDGTIVP